MHIKHIHNLLSLNIRDRYEYFIHDSVQFGCVWTLTTDEGYLIFTDKDGDEIFPVWSQEKLVEECMFDEHKEIGAYPIKIELEAFVNECISDMVSGGVLFGVFYKANREGLAVPGNTLKDALLTEHDEIWGEEE